MSELISAILRLIIFVPFIIFLIYLSLKVGGSKLQNIQNGRFLKILERVQISKENYILVIKIGEKGYVMSSTNDKIEMLMELTDEELLKVPSSVKIPEYKSIKAFIENIRGKKEDKND